MQHHLNHPHFQNQGKLHQGSQRYLPLASMTMFVTTVVFALSRDATARLVTPAAPVIANRTVKELLARRRFWVDEFKTGSHEGSQRQETDVAANEYGNAKPIQSQLPKVSPTVGSR